MSVPLLQPTAPAGPAGGRLRSRFAWAAWLALAALASSALGVGLAGHGLLARAAHGVARGAESFPPERIAAIAARLRLAGGLWLALALALIPGGRPGRALWSALAELPRQARAGLARAGRFAREERPHALVLVGLVVLAGVLGALEIRRPLAHDEVSTLREFVSRPALVAATNYTDTNNHVLFSLLAHASWRLLGEREWAIRVPALLAALAMVPAGYVAARTLVGRRAALVLAAALASWPYLLGQAGNARGYTLLMVWVLLAVAVGARLVAEPRPWRWALLALVLAAGFYTVPLMVYPAAGLGAWLVLEALRKGPEGGRARFFGGLAASAFGTIAVTLTLYSPPLVLGALEALAQKPWLQPGLEPGAVETTPNPHDRLELLTQFGGSLADIWPRWVHAEPGWLVAALAVLGLGLCLVRRPRAALLFVGVAAGTTGVVLAWGKSPPLWTFSYPVPLLLLAVSAGVAGALELGLRSERARDAVLAGVLALVVGAGVRHELLHHGRQMAEPGYSGNTDAPETAAYLARVLERGDIVAGLLKDVNTIHHYWERVAPGDDRLRFWVKKEHVLPFEASIRSIWLVECDTPQEWEPPVRAQLRAAIESLGFRPTEDVARFTDTRLVRYERMRGAFRQASSR